jgi:tetratricopeptide (TPR) repeat protein
MLTWSVAGWARIRQIRTSFLATAAVATLLPLGILTFRQIGYWHDVETFWMRTIALTEGNYIAHDTLAEYLSDLGRTDEAAAHFRAALAIYPDDLPANLGVGTYEHSRGNLPAAIERYRYVALHAGDIGMRAAAYGNLGSAYRQLGDLETAKESFLKSLELTPNRAMPLIGLGLIAQKAGNFADAERQYSRAMALEPTDVGYLLMAKAIEQEGRTAEAREIAERVERFSPNFAAAKQQAESLLAGK